MLAQTKLDTASRQFPVHTGRPTSPENSCTLHLSIDDCAPVPCLVCDMPMTLVRIKRKVVAFSGVNTYRCFACGDVCIVESKEAA